MSTTLEDGGATCLIFQSQLGSTGLPPGVQVPSATVADGMQGASPTTTPAIQSGMENFRKVKTSEEEAASPFLGLPDSVPEMKVKEGSKIRNLMGFAMVRMGATESRQIVFSGYGRAATKAVTCVEILKRKQPGLHQVTKVHYKTLQEVWEKQDPRRGGRVERLTVYKNVPSISILLSKDPLDTQEVGYQAPEPSGSIWTLGPQATTSTSLQTGKRWLGPPSPDRETKIRKVEQPPVAHLHFDYMLSCYQQSPPHLGRNLPFLYST
ncbi:ribonuclease P protein subunit p25 [Ambystoma mexicanum]|uniref:ribonuclease P protein subunit p25 n=1 Tax=Ambystoma mexicanum TaxID=8296 RepID=UPI0037E972AC